MPLAPLNRPTLQKPDESRPATLCNPRSFYHLYDTDLVGAQSFAMKAPPGENTTVKPPPTNFGTDKTFFLVEATSNSIPAALPEGSSNLSCL